jgi:hypothetical protein
MVSSKTRFALPQPSGWSVFVLRGRLSHNRQPPDSGGGGELGPHEAGEQSVFSDAMPEKMLWKGGKFTSVRITAEPGDVYTVA